MGVGGGRGSTQRRGYEAEAEDEDEDATNKMNVAVFCRRKAQLKTVPRYDPTFNSWIYFFMRWVLELELS